MTKKINGFLISFIGIFAFLFAGIFFVGCGVDYNKIYLVSDKASVSLEVGDSVDVTITIENYQNGFSNKIQVNPLSDGQTSIFSISEQKYISNNQIRLTIKGEAGGHGQLQIITLEAKKECLIDVSVSQHSNSMSTNSNAFYVSNKTNFVPNESHFVFDANTTDTELSHFFIKPGTDMNFNTFHLQSIDLVNMEAIFFDGTGRTGRRSIEQFEKVSLVKNSYGDDFLHFEFHGETKVFDVLGSFDVLSVYNYSLETGAENILNCVSTVHVLPDLDVKISGGYLQANGMVDEFTDILDEDFDENIKIVPNNTKMLQYILRVEMNNLENLSPIKLNVVKSNVNVIVDFCDYAFGDDAGKNVKYLKISQNSQKQSSTTLDFKIFYDIAKAVEGDESVNVLYSFDVDVEIAPTAIMVNGTTEPEKIKLYNFYKSPEFGWQDLLIDVISNYDTSPNFEGVYFEFESDRIDLMYNNITIASGNSKLYHDLSSPFQVRGKRDTEQIDNAEIKIHLVSDILEGKDELVLTVYYQIVEGAKEVAIEESYSALTYFNLDMDGGEIDFNTQIWANSEFKFVTIRCLSDVDGVEINTHSDRPFIYNEAKDRFYLNLSVKPKFTGTSSYSIVLDNGISVTLAFNCVKTLNPTSNPFKMTNGGNDAVTNISFSREGDVEFDNVMELEILNPSTKDFIEFGRVANFEIIANTTSVSFEPNDTLNVSINRNGSVYRITTKDNGDTKVTFRLSGLVVNDFRSENKEIDIYVWISSYSLVEEFYLKNGDNSALSNTVYYSTTSNIQEEAMSVKFSPVVNHKNSKNFYQYCFVKESFADVFENAVKRNEEDVNDREYTFGITAENFNSIVSNEIVKDTFNNNFIYFYALNSSGGLKSRTITVAKITKSYRLNGRDVVEVKNVSLSFYNSLMFFANNFEFVKIDDYGFASTFRVEFDNIFWIGSYGYLDLNSLTYRSNTSAPDVLVLNSNFLLIFLNKVQ